MKKKIVFLISLLIGVYGCSDQFEPAIQNIQGIEDTYKNPNFAQGLLISAYARIPSNGWSFSERATDDAVTNVVNNNYLIAATGQWASNYNPLDQWSSSRSAIQYINLMLEVTDNVAYAQDKTTSLMFNDRIKGEAYGLRALFMYNLLRSHGGMVDGQLLGVPIVTQSEGVGSNFNQPRATFEACMQQLYSDVDKALELLPLDYNNIGSVTLIPQKYVNLNATVDDYNRAFGDDSRLLMSGRIARAIRAQAALLAASPAFSQGNTTTWADAANYAAEIIDVNNGIAGLAPNGVTWYSNAENNNIGGGVNPAEILWRTSVAGVSSNLEADNFPPTLFGRGVINPTQNLVDAFPMANGYPINNTNSGYSGSNPYTDRDPRLAKFIVYNGSTAGINNTVINSSENSTTNDGITKIATSTRTGYYMRKLLRQDVNLNPTSVNGQRHIQPRIRYTEIYLIYAEAANEAWGPTAMGSHNYSAYDVVKAIRERAGITGGDQYLESIKNDKDAMRELIRNERRLELSFEGFRFWDLRRWKSNLNETTKGMRINGSNYEVINVENRIYSDYMIYGPIPYSETLKFNALQQNDGWD